MSNYACSSEISSPAISMRLFHGYCFRCGSVGYQIETESLILQRVTLAPSFRFGWVSAFGSSSSRPFLLTVYGDDSGVAASSANSVEDLRRGKSTRQRVRKVRHRAATRNRPSKSTVVVVIDDVSFPSLPNAQVRNTVNILFRGPNC